MPLGDPVIFYRAAIHFFSYIWTGGEDTGSVAVQPGTAPQALRTEWESLGSSEAFYFLPVCQKTANVAVFFLLRIR